MDRADRQLLADLIGRTAARALRVGLADLLELDGSDLASLGLGRPARRRLLACAEIARRYQPRASPPEPITGPAQALAQLSSLRSLNRETLVVLLLDIRLGLIAFDTIAIGSIAHVSAEAREVFAPAVAARASAIVLAHNHPSGNAEPSSQDIDFTSAMLDAGRVLNIDVVDHLIVTCRGFFSFRQHKRLFGAVPG
jgi:DNA repair protein RadC